jgi:hypothetical protein
MTAVLVNRPRVRATYVVVTKESMIVSLADGREIILPLGWYPRLTYGTPRERNEWRLVGDGSAIYWPDLDENLNVDGFLAGRRSEETSSSVRKWAAARMAARKKRLRPRSGS